jgi:hypothetical protein
MGAAAPSVLGEDSEDVRLLAKGRAGAGGLRHRGAVGVKALREAWEPGGEDFCRATAGLRALIEP